MISFAPVFVRLAGVGPSVAAFYRVAIGGIILIIWALLAGRVLWKGWRGWWITVLAGLFFALDLIFWHGSIGYVGPGLATILANFQVFVLAGFGIVFLREKLGLRRAASIPVAVLGLYLMVGINWSNLPGSYRWGVVLGLLTAVSYSAYLLTLRKSQSLPDPLSPIANLAVISLMTALLSGLAAAAQGERFLISDTATWGFLIGYAVVAQVMGWILITRGLPRVEASRAGLILLLQPSLAFLWDILMFRRPTTGIELAGAGLALAAIYFGGSSATSSPE